MAARETDYSFEALAEVTSTDWNTGRGELNMALRLIREQVPELEGESFMLAEMIRARAKLYREVMPDGTLLTPTALAKHWQRVYEESETRRSREAARGANQTATSSDECPTCHGDHFVLVGMRPAVASPLLEERGIKPTGEKFEEYAACPTCSAADTSFFRHDGTKSRALDPEKVRELMRR